jgi:8-oxo-dGTP pyrophosphatase MutT (NUDIX family)
MAAFTSPVDVLLVLLRGDEALLALRAGTGFADGWWNVPSGKLEAGEDAAAGLLREAREEVGLSLDRSALTLVTTVHYRPATAAARFGLFFQADPWEGEPVNAEPHKCAGLAWYPLDALPDNTYPYTRVGLEAFRKGRAYVPYGWDESPSRP